jgi:hypothetical protein
VTVEYIDETDVVKQRRDVIELIIESDVVRGAVLRSPQIRADAMVQQRG